MVQSVGRGGAGPDRDFGSREHLTAAVAPQTESVVRSAPMTTRGTHPAVAEHVARDSAQVVVGTFLVAVEPTGEGRDQELAGRGSDFMACEAYPGVDESAGGVGGASG